MLRLALAAVLLAPLSGCPAPAEVDPGPDAGPSISASDPALAEAMQRWADAGIEDYALTLQRICYCPSPDYTGPFRVAVDDGEIDSVRLNGTLVDDERGMSVEALFQLLEEAYSGDSAFGRPAERVTVEYHPDLGYPTSIGIDYDSRMADEEIGYRVSDLEKVG